MRRGNKDVLVSLLNDVNVDGHDDNKENAVRLIDEMIKMLVGIFFLFLMDGVWSIENKILYFEIDFMLISCAVI